MQTYIERLKPNPIPEQLKNISDLKSFLFDLRLEMCSENVSKDWTMDDLEKVLKKLKNNKARDAQVWRKRPETFYVENV